jgi:hypothetical protein
MKFYNISKFNNRYSISTKGIICDSNNNVLQPIQDGYRLYITIDNINYYIDELVWEMFVGELLGPIEYRDNNPSNVSVKNLYVKLNIDTFNTNTLIINDIEFSKIPGFNNYYISRKGTVYSIKRGILIIRNFNYAGYPVVPLVDNNGFRSPRKVHRMVYLTYIGELLPHLVIDHLDGNKQNPYYLNLEQVSPRENSYRAIEMELTDSRLSVSQIHELCKLLEENIPTTNIMKVLNMDNTYDNYRALTNLIHRIRNNKSYTDISALYNISRKVSGLNKKDRKLNVSDIIDIRNTFESNTKSIKQLADIYECSTKTISDIIYYKKWINIQNTI